MQSLFWFVYDKSLIMEKTSHVWDMGKNSGNYVLHIICSNYKDIYDIAINYYKQYQREWKWCFLGSYHILQW